MGGDPATAYVEPKDAESTQATVSQSKPTNCEYDNDKYKLECAECKRLVQYGCTSLPTYQLQLFLTKVYRKFICCKCVGIPTYQHAISLNRNEAHLKTVIKELEGELREQEERFTEVGNPDYDAFTKIEGSMKEHMKQLRENLMKNLLNELQDSKREMEEKINNVMIQTKRYAESVHISEEKNQTPNGTYIYFRAIMEETKNTELVEEKGNKLRSKNLIIHGVEDLLVTTNDAIKSDDIYANNFKAALKVTSTVKSVSRIGLLAQDKN